MKKILLVIVSLFLTGCMAPQRYTLEQLIGKINESMQFSEDVLSPLFSEEMLRSGITEEEITKILDYLGVDVDLDVYDEKSAEDFVLEIKNALAEKEFLSEDISLKLKERVIKVDDFSFTNPGYYEVDGKYYYVNEDLEYKEVELLDLLEDLEIHTTITPNLSETVIFPEGTTFDNDIVELEGYHLQPLAKRYFHYQIKDFEVRGCFLNQGLDLTIKRTDSKGNELSNHFLLDNLKLTADISLKENHHYLRADYHLKDTITYTKETSSHLKKVPLNEKNFAMIKNMLKSVSKVVEVDESNLDLLKFSIPVSPTLGALNVEVGLSLKMLLNGEAGITFETSASQGTNSVDGVSHKVEKQTFACEPFLDGDAEVCCALGMDLKLGKYLLADINCNSGIGATASTSIYFVNKDDVTKANVSGNYAAVEEILNGYLESSDFLVDVCVDVDTYWFIRFNAGSKSKSLLYQLGLNGSYTPLRKDLSLIHIEDHQMLPSCTRKYHYVELEKNEDLLTLSSYQSIMNVGDTLLLEVSGGDQQYQWFSSDNNVAEVVNGVVTAKKGGQATIKVMDGSGHYNECAIIVSKDNFGYF